jgi:glycosyltransferase involved in cell wall biosynthesis
MPQASIVIPTFNRSKLLLRAIKSVVGQSFSDFELIVVDDGGTDDTGEVVSAMKEERIRYVRRSNGGISAARNSGIAVASGEWVTFLDDDDEALQGWLEAFAELFKQPDVGIACIGAIHSNGAGPDRVVLPHLLKPVYERAFGLFIAGSFASRLSLIKEVGGFAEGLTCSHATELAMRLIPVCHRRGMRVASKANTLIRINRENPLNRPMSSPECLLQGVNYILRTHEDILKRSPDSISRYLSIAGVAAARMGLYKDCRRLFLKSVRTDPWKIRPYLRLLISMNRRLADYVWRYSDFGTDMP